MGGAIFAPPSTGRSSRNPSTARVNSYRLFVHGLRFRPAEVASDTQVSVMLREAAAMTALAHPNLLSAMGVVSDGPEPRRPRIVYMYYPSVNLKR